MPPVLLVLSLSSSTPAGELADWVIKCVISLALTHFHVFACTHAPHHTRCVCAQARQTNTN